MQRRNGLCGIGLDRIGHGVSAGQYAVVGHVNRGLAVGLPGLHKAAQRREIHAVAPHQRGIAAHQAMAIDLAGDTRTTLGLEPRNPGIGQVRRRIGDCTGNRVLGTRL